MIHFADLSERQRRLIYLALAGTISLVAIFSAFPRSHADPKPTLPIPHISEPAPSKLIVVDVAGRVVHPGVYKLTEGSRAVDAIKRAGGAIKGVSMVDINLAHILVDGEQIVVGAVAKVATSTSHAKIVGKSSSAIVYINSATSIQLQILAGVGPVMAGKIITYRNSHGPFTATSEIASVPGFGKKRFEAIAKQLRL